MMTNQGAASFVIDTLKDGEHDMGHVVEDLVQQCLLNDSKDNMTAMVVMLNGGRRYFTEKVKENRNRPRWVEHDNQQQQQ